MSTVSDILVEASLSNLRSIDYGHMQHHRNPCCKWSVPIFEYMCVYDTRLCLSEWDLEVIVFVCVCACVYVCVTLYM